MSLRPAYVDFNESFDRIKNTMIAVMGVKSVERRIWNYTFSDIYKLCVSFPEPQSDRLYDEVKRFLDSHIKNLLESVLMKANSNVLKMYHDRWIVFNRGIHFMDDLFLYLNHQHICKKKVSEAEVVYGHIENNQMEIGELGLFLWRKNMIEPLRDSLLSSILECLEQDRNGSMSDVSPAVVQGVIESFVVVMEKNKNELELYKKMFEGNILRTSGQYFRHLANEWVQSTSITEYMEKVLQLREDEMSRCDRFLHKSSAPELESWLDQHMVEEFVAKLNGESERIVTEERTTDMSNLYKLLKFKPSRLAPFVENFRAHVVRQTIQKLAGLSGDQMCTVYVDVIETAHKKYLNMVIDIVNNDSAFRAALDRAFITIVNHVSKDTTYRPAEMLCKFTDMLLKRSSRCPSDAELEDRMITLITIFRYLDDKDLFQKIYAKMLARRLVFQSSSSMDAEETMISKLKSACGYEFTSKLHRMYTDVKISEDLVNSFISYYQTNGNKIPFSFNVLILQAGSWPLSTNFLCPRLIPDSFNKAMEGYEKFYNTKFNGRKLTWLHCLSHGELKFSCGDKTYLVVNLNTFQFGLLMLFEKRQYVPCSTIVEECQTSIETLTKIVLPLLDAKLLISSTNDTLDISTVLHLNQEFSSKRTRVKILNNTQKDSPIEMTQTVQSVEEDRKLYLQALIVRIMKTDKLMNHNTLTQEVQRQCNQFSPTVSLVKKCIETLIEKQYIERTNDAKDEYSYIA